MNRNGISIQLTSIDTLKIVKRVLPILILFISLACKEKKNRQEIEKELQSLNLTRGDIALCGAENGEFGTVTFSLSCLEKVREKFNLATALLHSFEYTEAEKIFSKVIDEDPDCLM